MKRAALGLFLALRASMADGQACETIAYGAPLHRWGGYIVVL